MVRVPIVPYRLTMSALPWLSRWGVLSSGGGVAVAGPGALLPPSLLSPSLKEADTAGGGGPVSACGPGGATAMRAGDSPPYTMTQGSPGPTPPARSREGTLGVGGATTGRGSPPAAASPKAVAVATAVCRDARNESDTGGTRATCRRDGTAANPSPGPTPAAAVMAGGQAAAGLGPCKKVRVMPAACTRAGGGGGREEEAACPSPAAPGTSSKAEEGRAAHHQ